MPEKEFIIADQKNYTVISREIDDWLTLHRGESFDIETVCKSLNIVNSQSRKYASVKLSNEVKSGLLEKSNKTYIYINNDLVLLNDWSTAQGASHLDLSWPMGDDESKFGFDGNVQIPEKAIVVVAGVTNTGKSAFLRNVLWANMAKYHSTYFTSETSKEDFADYASRMTWANPFDENGQPVFDLVERHNDFSHVIRPDDINIIDWLNLGDQFYKLGLIIEGIKAKLNHGVCFIAIQKDPVKELGMGGQWGEHLSSLYLAMDYNRMTVKKAKKWQQTNTNGKSYGYTIVDGGCHFHDIHEVKKCPNCFKFVNPKCDKCSGTGWTNN